MVGIVHGGGLTAAMAAYGGAREDWLDLSTGINPNMPELPPIPVEVWNRLPDRGLVDAARAAALDWYARGDREFDSVEKSRTSDALPLAVPGTQSFIQLLPGILPEDRPVAILSPTYGEYAHCLSEAGFDVDGIASLDELNSDHGALVIVNPNNPDGRTFSRQELLALHIRMRDQGGHLHVDEAFGDARPEFSIAQDALELPDLTVSRSFGKFFGLAGVRLGFVFARPQILDAVEAELGPWAVSGPALYLATQMMSRGHEEVLSHILQRKACLDAVLGDASLDIVGGTELFALVSHEDATDLFDHLARSHILVRKFDYAPDWLRIGLTPDEQGDRKLAAALASFGK